MGVSITYSILPKWQGMSPYVTVRNLADKLIYNHYYSNLNQININFKLITDTRQNHRIYSSYQPNSANFGEKEAIP